MSPNWLRTRPRQRKTAPGGSQAKWWLCLVPVGPPEPPKTTTSCHVTLFLCGIRWAGTTCHPTAALALLVEHPLSKWEVVGSNPTGGFFYCRVPRRHCVFGCLLVAFRGSAGPLFDFLQGSPGVLSRCLGRILHQSGSILLARPTHQKTRLRDHIFDDFSILPGDPLGRCPKVWDAFWARLGLFC